MRRYVLLLAAVFGILLTLPQTAEARPYGYGRRVYARGYSRVYYGGGYYGRPYYRPSAYYGRRYYRPYSYYGAGYRGYGYPCYAPYYYRPGVSISIGY